MRLWFTLLFLGWGQEHVNKQDQDKALAQKKNKKILIVSGLSVWEAFLNNILNHGLSDSEKKPIVKIIPMSHPGIAVTTEFDTDIVKHKLWNQNLFSNPTRSPDVIINAYNAQDMFLPKRGWKTAEDYDYYHQQRQVIQDFIRASLLSACATPPVVINVDDYVGNQHGPVMADNTQARVLQLLSDYYEVALVSYAEVIRRLVYASEHSPLEHTNIEDWTSDWAVLSSETAESIMEHGNVGPIALTMTMAYAFLSLTVGYCSHQSTKLAEPDYSLMKEEVFQLADQVIPPVLNTDLCLTNVSDFWQEEKDKKQNNPQCNPESCEFAFWGGMQQTASELEDYLGLYIKEKSGWTLADGGRLIAEEEEASLLLVIPSISTLGETDKVIRIFSSRQDSEVEASKLEWELSVHTNRRGRKGFLMGTIDGVHDSPATVALPTTIKLGKNMFHNGTSSIELKLQLVEGHEFEVVAMTFCDDLS
jgi:hypothetical protein